MDDAKPLIGRVALITGASRGIGAAVAKRFATAGAHVVLLARTVGGLEEVDDAIQAGGGRATLVPLDLRKLDGIDPLGPQLLQRFGRLDILVGNAGLLGTIGPLSHHDATLFDEVFAVNVAANWRLIRTLEPLLKQSDAGRAIFVTSGAAKATKPYRGPYGASKAALDQMVLSWALELVDSPVRVNLLSPGPTRTEMRVQAMPGEDPNTVKPPEAVADVCLELALPSCTRHGQIVDVHSSSLT